MKDIVKFVMWCIKNDLLYLDDHEMTGVEINTVEDAVVRLVGRWEDEEIIHPCGKTLCGRPNEKIYRGCGFCRYNKSLTKE